MSVTRARVAAALVGRSRRTLRAAPGRSRAAQAPAPAAPPAAVTVCGTRCRLRPRCRRPARPRSSGSSALLRRAGQRLDRRAADLPVLHPAAQREPAVAGHLGAVRRAGRADRCATDFKRCGRPTSSTTCRSRSTDYTFSNGVVGKIVTYHMEERERVKIVDYEGSKQIDRTKIDEKLRERSIELRLDSFLDDGDDPPRRRRAARDDGGEGLHQRRGHPQGHAGGRRPEAGERHVQRRARGRRSRSATSSSSATRRSATARCSGR